MTTKNGWQDPYLLTQFNMVSLSVLIVAESSRAREVRLPTSTRLSSLTTNDDEQVCSAIQRDERHHRGDGVVG